MEINRSLEISDIPENLDQVVDRLMAWKKVFRFLPSKSREYAQNVFVKQNEAFCFKTDRSSLYNATIWMVRYGNIIKVSNITADISLDMEKYNDILIQFVSDVIYKTILSTTKVNISDSEMSFKDILDTDTYTSFRKWYDSCNKVDLISHTSDLRLFIAFVRDLYFNAPQSFEIDLFGKMIKESRPYLLESKIKDIENKIEFGLEVFKFEYENKK